MRNLKFTTLVVFGLSILFLFFFQYCKHAPGLGTVNPFGEDPYDAVGSFGVLLAPLAALLTLVHVFRPYRQKQGDPAQLLLALRGGTVTLLSVAVTLVADLIGLGRAVLAGGIFPAAGSLAALVGGMGLLSLLTGWAFLRSARRLEIPTAPRPWRQAVAVSGLAGLVLAFYPLGWRESGIPGGIFTALLGMALLFVTVWALAMAIYPQVELSHEDIFDDLASVFQGWKRSFGRFAVPLVWLEKIARLPFVKKLFGWLRPRRHRWNLVILIALFLGLFLLLPEVIVEGLSPNLERFLLVVGVYVGIGGAGVLLGYVMLGKYLGIY